MNSPREEKRATNMPNADGHSVDGYSCGYLSYASTANMKVTGTWGHTEIVVHHQSVAVKKSKPQSGEAVGLLSLELAMHLKVLNYLKPDLAVRALLQERKERNMRSGGGGSSSALHNVDPWVA